MNVPDDLKYSSDHEWIRADGNRITVGITDYAQDALGDVVFVQVPDQGATVAAGAGIQPGLHWTDIIKQTKGNECNDISWDGERQKQGPGKKSPSRKITYRSKPCQAHSQTRCRETPRKASQKVFATSSASVVSTRCSHIARWREKRGQNGTDGYQYKGGDENRNQAPADGTTHGAD